ncbi:hypothetical protein COY95_03925 [Candidatus Woesearchaeota archaeon CG_4_10_14_0_8_um_filter_47_5]|nr:MAG: hypothetical protein COY95_03925 [Candidatus Woesearchaeota archaeon CG_4_10_14_0_8_um_filter_47_5]
MNYEEIYDEGYFNGKRSFFDFSGYRNSGYYKRYFANEYFQVKEYVNRAGGRVLDVGCAYGFLLEQFPSSFEKYGIDVSGHAVSVAKKRMPEGKFYRVGAEDLKPGSLFPTDFFDVIVFNNVIEHLMNPKKSLRNIFSLLKKGGLLYLTAPNLNIIRKILFYFPDKMEYHISLMSFPEMNTLLSTTGYRVLQKWTCINLIKYLKFSNNLGIDMGFICERP